MQLKFNIASGYLKFGGIFGGLKKDSMNVVSAILVWWVNKSVCFIYACLNTNFKPS